MKRIALILLLSCSWAMAGTYYVSPTTSTPAGNDTTGNGSAATPWATVDKAIATVSLGSHHDILLANGSYEEDTWDVRARDALDVTIKPVTGATVSITMTNAYRAFWTAAAVTLTISMENITLSMPNLDGVARGVITIESTATATFTFTNCTLSATTGRIFLLGASATAAKRQLVVRGGTYTSGTSATCLYADDAYSIDVQDATFNGGTGGTTRTIECYQTNTQTATTGALVRVVGCTVDKAIYVPNGYDDVVLTGNTCTQNVSANAATIINIGVDGHTNASPIERAKIIGNTVRYAGTAKSHGILCGSGINHLECEDNTILNSSDGLVVKSGSNQTAYGGWVRGNVVYDTGANGLELKGAKGLLIEHNTCVTNTNAGMYWSNDASAPDTMYCVIRNNAFYGPEAVELKDFVGTTNTVDYNSYHATGATFATITGTTYATLALYKAAWSGKGVSANDVHSVGNPLLLNTTSTFNVSLVSPAIGAGYPRFTFNGTTYGPTIGAWQPPAFRRVQQIQY